jgi:signal transduction histidine kinase
MPSSASAWLSPPPADPDPLLVKILDVLGLTDHSPCQPCTAERWLAAALLLLVMLCMPTKAAAAAASVLVVYSNGRLLPANVEADRGIRQILGAATDRTVAVHDEFLDAPLFSGQAHEDRFARYLGEKYAHTPPAVVIAMGPEALGFLLRHGRGQFPQAQLVHGGVEASSLLSLGPLPPQLVGATVSHDFVRTIEQALRWHPQTRRLLVVTGASERDREWGARLRNESRQFEGRVRIELLDGLPMRDVLTRLRGLGPGDLVYTPGIFQDGDGVASIPRGSAQIIAAASTAPVYAPHYLGTGVVGGYMQDYESVARHAAQTAQQLLEGVAPAALATSAPEPVSLQLDWRQLQRWKIDADSVPADAVVRFRERTFFEENKLAVVMTFIIITVQFASIAWLLAERRRRQSAELAVAQQRHELTQVSRRAMTAELMGAIAHEINQPLSAIVSNADAAELGLKGGPVSPELLSEIMADIHHEAIRASEVVKSLRSLYASGPVQGEPVDLNSMLAKVESFLRVECKRRGVSVEVVGSAQAVVVVVGRIETQQVLINLVLNAMDAVDGQPDDRRQVKVTLQTQGGTAVVVVSDRGPGIAPEHLPRLFEPFFTTKANGMGLGLSISRRMIEAYEGTLSAANAPEGGAVFRIVLPLAPSADAAPGQSA